MTVARKGENGRVSAIARDFADAIEDQVGAIAKDVARTISFGVGRTNEERVEHDLFDDADAWKAGQEKVKKDYGFTDDGLRDLEGWM